MLRDQITVSPNWVKGIMLYAEQIGCETHQVLKQAGLPSNAGKSTTRLTMDETVKLWGACIDHSNDPYFGLHFGEQVRPSTFHIVGYTLMNAANLNEAFEKLNQYQRLISDGGIFQKVPVKQGVWVIYHQRPGSLPFFHHQIDAVIAALLSFSQWITGKSPSPIDIALHRKQPTNTQEYKRVFGITPSFNADFDGVLISNEVMNRPLLEADEELCKIHEFHAKQRLDELKVDITIKQQVSQILTNNINRSNIGRAYISQQLGLSEKSLQRKLNSEGTSCRAIHDQIRKDMAINYINDTNIPLTEVALLLGFSDASAFYKAFKRWTGRTPGNFKEEN